MPGGDGWTVKGGQFTRDGGGGAELRSDGESGHELRGLVYPPRVGGGVADSNRVNSEGAMTRSSLDRAGYLQAQPGDGNVRGSVSESERSCRAKYTSMTLSQLRRQCEDAWLEASGNENDLIERLVDYEKPAKGWPLGNAAANVEPKRYTVKIAAKRRAGFEATSQDLGVASVGEVITELESRVNNDGITRVRYADGWLSLNTRDGRQILEEILPDSAGSMQLPQDNSRQGWQPTAPRQAPQQVQPPHADRWQSAAPAPQPGSDEEAACRAKYSSMTIEQLRRCCEDAWISTSGSVRDLVDRLVDYEKPRGGWPAAASSQQNLASSRGSGYESTNASGRYEPEPQIIDRYGDNRLTTTPQMADRYGSSAERQNFSDDYGRDNQQQQQQQQHQHQHQHQQGRPDYGQPGDRQREFQEPQPQRAFSHQNERDNERPSQHMEHLQSRHSSERFLNANASTQHVPQHHPQPPLGAVLPDLDRELESVSRELVEAARHESPGRFTRLEDQIHQLAKQHKAQLLAIKDPRMLQLAGDCVRSAALYVLKDASNIRQPQKLVIDEGETSYLKEASMILLASLAENQHLEADFNHSVGSTQRTTLDVAVLVIRAWAGPDGMRKDSTKAAASPWRAGNPQPKVLDNVIRQAVTVLCFVAYNASDRRRQEMSLKKYPDLVGMLVEVGRERNPRHGSILAFATVAFLTGTRVEPDSAPGNAVATSRRAGPDDAMIDELCQAFDLCMRDDSRGSTIETLDSARPKAEHSHLIAEAIYEMTRTAGNARLLLRQDTASRLLLEACVRYRGSCARQVVHAASHALLCLSLDVRGAQVLDKHGHALDTLRRVSQSRDIDEETRVHADRACFALKIRQEAEERAGRQPYLTASLSGAPSSGSILVSYTKMDEKKAIALVNGLRLHNFNAQIIDASDLRNMTGSRIASTVDSCAALLLCCSRSYRESSRCHLEVAYARARRAALRDIGPAIVPIIVSSGFKSSAAGWLTDIIMKGRSGSGDTPPGAIHLSDVDIAAEADRAARAQQVLRSIGSREVEQLRQIRRSDAPPPLQLVLDAVATLLGRKPEQPRDPNRGLFAEEGLLQQLQTLIPTPALVSAARRFTTNPLCTPEAVNKTSPAGRLLCEWVRAVTSEFAGLVQCLKQLAAPQFGAASQSQGSQQNLTVHVPSAAGSVGSFESSLGQIQATPSTQPEVKAQLQPQGQMQPYSVRPQPEPQQQPVRSVGDQPTAPTQRPPTSGSVPPPIQQQHLSSSLQTFSTHAVAAAASVPARPAPNVALSAMDSAAVEAWLRRKGLAELFPKLQSSRMDHGAALSWISIQLRDPRAEVLSKCEDRLKMELQVPLGVLYQFLYHVEHFTNSL